MTEWVRGFQKWITPFVVLHVSPACGGDDILDNDFALAWLRAARQYECPVGRTEQQHAFLSLRPRQSGPETIASGPESGYFLSGT